MKLSRESRWQKIRKSSSIIERSGTVGCERMFCFNGLLGNCEFARTNSLVLKESFRSRKKNNCHGNLPWKPPLSVIILKEASIFVRGKLSELLLSFFRSPEMSPTRPDFWEQRPGLHFLKSFPETNLNLIHSKKSFVLNIDFKLLLFVSNEKMVTKTFSYLFEGLSWKSFSNKTQNA